MHTEFVVAQSPHVGVVEKFGECSASSGVVLSFDRGTKLRGSSPKDLLKSAKLIYFFLETFATVRECRLESVFRISSSSEKPFNVNTPTVTPKCFKISINP
ncbi:hypothetical protein TNCV_347031 [Trichonephila clavipes]|nr:hypothetical protein TNCV_347031 [Trichonephila clavipes]